MFLLGKDFLLRTDHSAVCNLLRRDLPPTTRVERWILRLSQYTFRIEHQRGQDNVIADVLSRLPFATREEGSANSVSTATWTSISKPLQQHTAKLTGQTSDSSTCSEMTISQANQTSMKAIQIQTQTIYGMEFGEIPEQWCESEAELCNLNQTSAQACNFISISTPFVNIPISRKGLVPEEFSIPTREELATEQEADTELNQLRNWIESKQCPLADELAGLSSRMKSLAQLFDQMSIRAVFVIRRHDDPERELTIVSSTQVEHIIQFYHEGPGAAHQAPKATSAKIIGCFWWPDLKRDVPLYVACCPVCERFIWLNRTPKAGLRSIEVCGR